MSLDTTACHARLLFSLACGAGLACSACAVSAQTDDEAVGQSRAGIHNCPPEVCGTAASAGSLPAAPPPSPTTAVIPAAFVRTALNFALTGTEIQVSQTTGDTLSFSSFATRCDSAPPTA